MNNAWRLSRRQFGRAVAAWPAAGVAAGAAALPSETVRIGVVGIGVRGKYLIGNLPAGVLVTAICDCAQSRLASALRPQGEFVPVLARFRESDAASCKAYQDYRRMLDNERLDAVIIATPDHHHVPAAMRALQAGLDVYLEKPLTVAIREGRQLADRVKSSGRVLQVGSQQRTMEMNRAGCEFVRDGGLGKVARVQMPNYPGPLSILDLTEEAIPGGLDWDLFCGPAPLRPYNRKLWVKDEFSVGDLLWRGWDLFWDYSGHMMTNWGAHSVDMVQYALGRDDTGPVEIRVVQPESLQAVWEFWKSKTPAPLDANERRFWPVLMRYADGVELQFTEKVDTIVFHGERGRLKMRRNFFETDPPDLVREKPDPEVLQKWQGDGHVARPHLENWLDCVRSRGEPNAPIEVGHRTATICHLANLARELNRPLRWNPITEQFVGDAEASELLERPQRGGYLPV